MFRVQIPGSAPYFFKKVIIISYIRDELKDEDYNNIKKSFPTIENDLFLNLDSLIVAHKLLGYKIAVNNFSIGFSTKKVMTKRDFGHWVRVYYNSNEKKMEINLIPIKLKKEIFDELSKKGLYTRKKLRRNQDNDKSLVDSIELKYNHKNCKRLYRILTVILNIVWSKEG